MDVVLLKSVLHDWNDDDAVRILQRARDALAPDSRVLVIERVMPAQVDDLPAHRATSRSDGVFSDRALCATCGRNYRKRRVMPP